MPRICPFTGYYMPESKKDWTSERLDVMEELVRTYSNLELHESVTGLIFLADNARRKGAVWSAMSLLQQATLCRLELKRRGWKLPG